jgi:hypothetical protein
MDMTEAGTNEGFRVNRPFGRGILLSGDLGPLQC